MIVGPSSSVLATSTSHSDIAAAASIIAPGSKVPDCLRFRSVHKVCVLGLADASLWLAECLRLNVKVTYSAALFLMLCI